jgi:hypothetical protein
MGKIADGGKVNINKNGERGTHSSSCSCFESSLYLDEIVEDRISINSEAL